jgi:hypothetical protein
VPVIEEVPVFVISDPAKMPYAVDVPRLITGVAADVNVGRRAAARKLTKMAILITRTFFLFTSYLVFIFSQ